jgi:predicted nucleic acid-binding protein
LAHLVDTNILLRRRDTKHPQFQAADEAVTHLQSRKERLCVARQNLIEFRNVASRPLDKNGLGLSPADANLDLDIAEREFDVLAEDDLVYKVWRQLIAVKGVSGKQVHDTRLVASMLVYGITHLLTFNGADFRRFETLPSGIGTGIVVVNPRDVH